MWKKTWRKLSMRVMSLTFGKRRSNCGKRRSNYGKRKFCCCAGSCSRTGAPLKKRSVLDALLDVHFTPSSLYREPNTLKKLHLDVVNLYRWESTEGSSSAPAIPQAPPLTLLDPLLARFALDLKVMTPTDDDQQFTWRLARKMSRTFPSEPERVQAFWDSLYEYFPDVQGYVYMTIAIGKTDGTVCGTSGGMITNLEGKNEVGSDGGCCHLQNAGYALLYVSRKEMATIRTVSRCPTVLMELAGPNLSFSAFAYTEDRMVWDQLTPLYPMAASFESGSLVELARCFCALRSLLPKLINHYRDLEKSTIPDAQLVFPYPNSYVNGGRPISFTYLKALNSNSSTCYLGESEVHGKIVIKFVKAYGVDAHKAMAERGYAPKLHDVVELPGWFMLVVEYEDGHLWFEKSEVSDTHKNILKDCVETLHSSGFVHGDLRACNVIVTRTGVKLIDFEWAGNIGVAKYPMFMNREKIPWPEGVHSMELVKIEHDKYWLDRLCSDPLSGFALGSMRR